ncbi:MAG: GTPase-activating protein [Lichina confinis]|nr:MAG: GTPase-activating protein [Lichina confinis]
MARKQIASSKASPAPFWRTRSSESQSKGRDASKVVGAAYSHADMLKFDSLNITPGSRPQTPPSIPRHGSPRSNGTPSKSGSGISSPPRKTYSDFLSTTNDDWNLEDEDERARGIYSYDDNSNEDEFGLPSLASVRRKVPRIPVHSSYDPGGTFGLSSGGDESLLQSRPPPGRRRANSSDIAEERGTPNYPSARKNPANALNLINYPPRPVDATPKEIDEHASRITRINKFKRILQASSISLSDLRDASWNGIPGEVRAMSWQLLLGYLPTGGERRVATLERKRKEYLDGVQQAFDRGKSRGSTGALAEGAAASSSGAGRARGLDEAIWHQISIDVPRTNPHLKLYGYEATQRSLERILYLWAIRHPASGYVQGINDLVTPFLQVFLGSYITDPDIEFGMDPGQLPRPVLDAVEADSYWCLTKLLDDIQDNYIFAQPGIQRQVGALRDLTMRIDAGLAKHLESEGVQFIQFSFRWMNCLLMREISLKNTIRMWDTYMAEEQGFSHFHVYVCAAFLVKWSEQLVKMDFQEIMMFLQALPTRQWTNKDIELLLSEAFIWQSLFRGSSAHLRNPSDPQARHVVI